MIVHSIKPHDTIQQPLCIQLTEMNDSRITAVERTRQSSEWKRASMSRYLFYGLWLLPGLWILHLYSEITYCDPKEVHMCPTDMYGKATRMQTVCHGPAHELGSLATECVIHNQIYKDGLNALYIDRLIKHIITDALWIAASVAVFVFLLVYFWSQGSSQQTLMLQMAKTQEQIERTNQMRYQQTASLPPPPPTHTIPSMVRIEEEPTGDTDWIRHRGPYPQQQQQQQQPLLQLTEPGLFYPYYTPQH